MSFSCILNSRPGDIVKLKESGIKYTVVQLISDTREEYIMISDEYNHIYTITARCYQAVEKIIKRR